MLSAGGGLPSTGGRNITSLLEGSVSGGTAYIIRVGPVVTVSFESITFSGSNPGYNQMLRLPSGFRPPFTLRDNYAAPSSSAQLALFGNGSVSTNQPAGDVLRREITFCTTDSWPSSLPGTAI